MPYPYHEAYCNGYHAISRLGGYHGARVHVFEACIRVAALPLLVVRFSVARVQPRTSKGITDLLLLFLVRLESPPVPVGVLVRDSGRTRMRGPFGYHHHAPRAC